ncbi:hypothetical protein, partial [Moorena sp. SIO3H5]|uniref:hypothetical protein n=1 Tax=Moorena sp. SIO3H5 TaxID=2607834 RepID=UPI0025DD9A7B
AGDGVSEREIDELIATLSDHELIEVARYPESLKFGKGLSLGVTILLGRSRQYRDRNRFRESSQNL